MKKIQDFLLEYANAVNKIDLAEISAHFDNNFMLSTQNNCWYLQNNGEFKKNLAKAFVNYKKLGATICKMLTFEVINFKSNHFIANIESNNLINYDC